MYVGSEEYKQTNKTETGAKIQRTDSWFPEGRGCGGLGEKGEGIEKYRLVVTE